MHIFLLRTLMKKVPVVCTVCVSMTFNMVTRIVSTAAKGGGGVNPDGAERLAPHSGSI